MGVKIQTAMIIDDDEDLGRLLTHILEERKIHVLTVHTLSEAETYLAYLKPTVIFLDNSFPEGLGINFIKSIRSTDDEIIIIMMTADTALWIEQKAFEEGVSFFLKKPFSKKAINTTLDQLNFQKQEA
jgi:two-component system, OmpR family, response regulator